MGLAGQGVNAKTQHAAPGGQETCHDGLVCPLKVYARINSGVAPAQTGSMRENIRILITQQVQTAAHGQEMVAGLGNVQPPLPLQQCLQSCP